MGLFDRKLTPNEERAKNLGLDYSWDSNSGMGKGFAAIHEAGHLLMGLSHGSYIGGWAINEGSGSVTERGRKDAKFDRSLAGIAAEIAWSGKTVRRMGHMGDLEDAFGTPNLTREMLDNAYSRAQTLAGQMSPFRTQLGHVGKTLADNPYYINDDIGQDEVERIQNRYSQKYKVDNPVIGGIPKSVHHAVANFFEASGWGEPSWANPATGVTNVAAFGSTASVHEAIKSAWNGRVQSANQNYIQNVLNPYMTSLRNEQLPESQQYYARQTTINNEPSIQFGKRGQDAWSTTMSVIPAHRAGDAGVLRVEGMTVFPNLPLSEGEYGLSRNDRPTSVTAQRSLVESLFRGGTSPRDRLFRLKSDEGYAQDEMTAMYQSAGQLGTMPPALSASVQNTWSIHPDVMQDFRPDRAGNMQTVYGAPAGQKNEYNFPSGKLDWYATTVAQGLKEGERRVLVHPSELFGQDYFQYGPKSTVTNVAAMGQIPGAHNVTGEGGANLGVMGLGESSMAKLQKRFRQSGFYPYSAGTINDTGFEPTRLTQSLFKSSAGGDIFYDRTEQLLTLGSLGIMGQGQALMNQRTMGQETVGEFRNWSMDLPTDEGGRPVMPEGFQAALEAGKGRIFRRGEQFEHAGLSMNFTGNYEAGSYQNYQMVDDGKRVMFSGWQAGAEMSAKGGPKAFSQRFDFAKLGLDNGLADKIDIMQQFSGNPQTTIANIFGVMNPEELSSVLGEHADRMIAQGMSEQKVNEFGETFFDPRTNYKTLRGDLKWDEKTTPAIMDVFFDTYLKRPGVFGEHSITTAMTQQHYEDFVSNEQASVNRTANMLGVDPTTLSPVSVKNVMKGENGLLNVTASFPALRAPVGTGFRPELAGSAVSMNSLIRRHRQQFGDPAEAGALASMGSADVGPAQNILSAAAYTSGALDSPGAMHDLSDINSTEYTNAKFAALAAAREAVGGRDLTSAEQHDTILQVMASMPGGDQAIQVASGKAVASPQAMQRYISTDESGQAVGIGKNYAALMDEAISSGQGLRTEDLTKLLGAQEELASSSGLRHKALGAGRTREVGWQYTTENPGLQSNEIVLNRERMAQLMTEQYHGQGYSDYKKEFAYAEMDDAAKNGLSHVTTIGANRNPALAPEESVTYSKGLTPAMAEARGVNIGQVGRNMAVTGADWNAAQGGDVDADALSAYAAFSVDKAEYGRGNAEQKADWMWWRELRQEAKPTSNEELARRARENPAGEYANQRLEALNPKLGKDAASFEANLRQKLYQFTGKEALAQSSLDINQSKMEMGQFYNWGLGFEGAANMLGLSPEQYGGAMGSMKKLYQQALDLKGVSSGVRTLQELGSANLVTGYTAMNERLPILDASLKTRRRGGNRGMNLPGFANTIVQGLLQTSELSNAEVVGMLGDKPGLSEAVAAARSDLSSMGGVSEDMLGARAMRHANDIRSILEEGGTPGSWLGSNAPGTMFATGAAVKAQNKGDQFWLEEPGGDFAGVPDAYANDVLGTLASRGRVAQAHVALGGKGALSSREVVQTLQTLQGGGNTSGAGLAAGLGGLPGESVGATVQRIEAQQTLSGVRQAPLDLSGAMPPPSSSGVGGGSAAIPPSAPPPAAGGGGSGGGGQPPHRVMPTPPGGGGGNIPGGTFAGHGQGAGSDIQRVQIVPADKQYTPEMGEEILGKAAAFGDKLKDLAKVFDETRGSTEKLTEAQTKTVKSTMDLYRDLDETVADLSYKTKYKPQATGEAALLGQLGQMGLGGNLTAAQDMLMGGAGPSLAARAVRASETGVYQPESASLNDKLMPFFQRGRAGVEARARGREAGWYGESGLEQGAWTALGTAAAIPNFLVQSRYAIRGVESEFITPITQGRQQYLAAQQQFAMQSAQFQGFAFSGSDQYRAAFNPAVREANRQYTYGEMANRTIGGISDAVSGLMGSQTAAGLQVGGSLVMAGSALGMMAGGPVGSLIGAGVGAAAFMAGQIASYGTDQTLRNRMSYDLSQSGAGGVLKKDFFGGVAFGLQQLGEQIADPKQFREDYTKRLSGSIAAQQVSRASRTLRPEDIQYLKEHPGDLQTGLMGMFGMPGQEYMSGAGSLGQSFESAPLLAGLGENLTTQQQLTLATEAYYTTGGAAGLRDHPEQMVQDFKNLRNMTLAGVTDEDRQRMGFNLQAVSGYTSASVATGGYASAMDKLAKFIDKNSQAVAIPILNDILPRTRQIALAQAGAGQKPITGDEAMAISQQTADAQGDFTKLLKIQGNLDLNDMWAQGAGSSALFTDEGKAQRGGVYDLLQGELTSGDRQRYLADTKSLPTYGAMAAQLQIGFGMSAGAANVYTAGIAKASAVGTSDQVKQATSAYLATRGIKVPAVAEMVGASYEQMFTAGIDPSQMENALISGRNIRPGTPEYDRAVADARKVWDTKQDVPDYTNKVAAAGAVGGFNYLARQGGLTGLADGAMDKMNPENRSAYINAENVIVQTKNATGVDMSGSAIAQRIAGLAGSQDPASIHQMTVLNNQMGQAAAQWGSRLQYGGATEGKLNQTLGWANTMNQQDFSMMMGADAGNPLAMTQAFKRGLVSDTRFNQINLDNEGSAFYGTPIGYANKPSVDLISRRKEFAGATGLGRAGGAYDWNTLMGESQLDLQKQMRTEEIKTRDYDFALAQTQLSRQQASVLGTGLGNFVAGAEGKGAWYFEDQNRMLGRAQQDFSYAQQGKGLALQKQQMQYDYQYQAQSMQIQRGHQVTEQQWGIQDIEFGRNVSAVQYGFSMIDADENIRYSRGRERRVAMRHRDEATVNYSMQEGQRDREEERAKERIHWGDQQFQRDQEHFQKSYQFQQQNFQLTEENYKKEREFILQQRSLEDQQRTINRALAVQEMTEAQASLTFHQQEKKTMDELSAAVQSADNGLSLFIKNMQTIATLGGTINTPSTTGVRDPQGTTVYPTLSGAQLSSAIAQLGQPITDSATLTSIAGLLKGHKAGGFTGVGNPNAVAGSVHFNEYVVPEKGALVLRGDNSEHTDLFKEIRDILKLIYRDGTMQVVMTQPQQAVKQGKALAQQVWN